MTKVFTNKIANHAGVVSQNYDPKLIEAIVDELKEKLNLGITSFFMIIQITLPRSNQFIDVTFSSDHVGLRFIPLPDGSFVEPEKHNLFDPEFDPIKQICRFVDKALKLEASHENKNKGV